MSKGTVRKRRPSLVRYLASWVPAFIWKFFLPETPRMYISLNLLQEICDYCHINSPSDDSNTSFCNFKPNFHNRRLQQMYNSTPKKDQEIENDKLQALQQQLDEIKQLVAKLVERQTEQCSGYGTLSNPSDHLQKSFAPPPPPPPPPPIPQNFSLNPPNSPLPIKKNKSLLIPKINQYGFPYGEELLKDLKQVQLKKIEKSPNGGPLKKPQNGVGDPGDFLATVLKKRFGKFQYSPDSSHESSSLGVENSFTSGTNCSYEIDTNIKNVVLSQ